MYDLKKYNINNNLLQKNKLLKNIIISILYKVYNV